MTNMLQQTNFDNFKGYGIDQLNGKEFTQGAGFTGTGTIVVGGAQRFGNMAITDLYLDLTGLNSSAAGDIIGGDGLSSCYFGQVKDEINGIPDTVRVECLEAPAGGEPDIDIYAAVESTGAEDAAVSALTETAVIEAAADWTLGAVKYANLNGVDLTDKYLYLVGSGGGTDATYTAGKFRVTFFGTLS